MNDSREGSLPPPSKRRKRDEIADKKNKACHECRRVKLKCISDTDGGPCRRCLARGDECRFTVPLHDLKWQSDMSSRMDHLTSSVSFIMDSLEVLHRHLGLPFNPPAPPQPPSPSIVDPSPSTSARKLPVVPVPKEAPAPVERLPPPSHDYSTQCGAEELLAQAYARFPAPFPMPDTAEASDAALLLGHSPSRLAGLEASTNLFGLLDWTDGEMSPTLTKGDMGIRPMAARLLGSADLTAIGSQDPRVDIVKNGVISSTAAETLCDFFHSQVAPHLFGFPLRLREWPYLPAGKSTITPLILGSICLIAAERMPAYHDLLPKLTGSDLSESILNASPGLSFAPGSDSQPNGLEPDLDLELGIGPEEICALLLYATFSCSPRSDIIARTAFEWTRGYLKTFMLPSPPPVTYGEVFGLLTARRDLSFENWLRLWLFGYVVDVQQSLHHERRAPVFDPHYFCDTLLAQSLTSSNVLEQQSDRSLVAHSRLCAMLQRIQYVRSSPGWQLSTAQDMVASHEQWNLDLEKWWTAQDLVSHGQVPDLPLILFRLFARIYLNLAASKEVKLTDNPVKWRFLATSARAAHEMLETVVEDGVARNVNLLMPFYVKMISLAAIVLFDAFRDSAYVVLPCTHEQCIDLVSRIANNLAQAPVPKTHACRMASSSLIKLCEKRKASGTTNGSTSGGSGTSSRRQSR